MTIDLNPPIRFRIPAQKFLDVLDSDDCRGRADTVWPAETEVTLPDPDTATPTPSPDFRPLSPILDTMSQARYHLQQQGFGSAHYVEITHDHRYQVVKRNLLGDRLDPIIDQYGWPAVQSVLLSRRPVATTPAGDPVCPVPIITEVEMRPDPSGSQDPIPVPHTPAPAPVEEVASEPVPAPDLPEAPEAPEAPEPEPEPEPTPSEQPVVPKAKKSKKPKDRDRREYHREYRRKQRELLALAQQKEIEMDTNDLIKDTIEKNKTPANPDGTGTPVINDEIQAMVTDADKITGTDTGTHIITDPDVAPKVTDENPYAIEPEIHTGSETVSDTVTPVVHQSTTPSVNTEIPPTERKVDEDALRANRNADETPVTQAQPVPDAIHEPKKEEVKPEPAPASTKQAEPAQKAKKK